MKNCLRLLSYFSLVCGSFPLHAQDTTTRIQVTVTDKETAEVMPFGTVALTYLSGEELKTATTNMEGEAVLAGILPGKYHLKTSFAGYDQLIVTNVEVPVIGRVIVLAPVKFAKGRSNKIDTIQYSPNLESPKKGRAVTREDYENMSGNRH